MNIKYYIATIEERYGEFEVKESLLLRLPESFNPNKHMEEYNRDWYGQGCTEADEDESGWIDNDFMKHRAGDLAEISEECFNELAATKVVHEVSD